jgi:hypothetical protein
MVIARIPDVLLNSVLCLPSCEPSTRKRNTGSSHQTASPLDAKTLHPQDEMPLERQEQDDKRIYP